MAEKPWGPKQQGRARRIVKRLHVVTDKNGKKTAEQLLPLRIGEEVSLLGPVEFRIVRGQIEILGAILRPSASCWRIDAPNGWGSLPRVKGVAREEPDLQESEEVMEFLSNHGWPIVLCMRPVGRKELQLTLAEVCNPQAIFPRVEVHRAWRGLADAFSRIASPIAKATRPAAIIVTGPKGVGKSSCCRFLINSIAASYGHVCLLETDLGQPELCPPGLVALHKVLGPVLRSPCMAHRSATVDCIATYFVGAVTPAAHPLRYLACVRAAYQKYLELCQGLEGEIPPLIINSHGWASGLGLHMVRTIAKVTGAQLIVKIRAASKAGGGGARSVAMDEAGVSEFDDGSPQVGTAAEPGMDEASPFPPGFDRPAAPGIDSKVKPVVVEVDSVAPPVTQRLRTGHVMQPNELRWLRIACYLRPDWDWEPAGRLPQGPVTAFLGQQEQRRLLMDDVAFGYANRPMVATEVEAAMTGSVVALCRLETHCLQAVPEGNSLRLLDLGDDDAPLCLGLAFLHAFDSQRREVLLYTPLSHEDLDRVNAVVRGDIVWTPFGSQQRWLSAGGGFGAFAAQPYVCRGVMEGLGSGAKSITRKVVQRAGQKRAHPGGSESNAAKRPAT